MAKVVAGQERACEAGDGRPAVKGKWIRWWWVGGRVFGGDPSEVQQRGKEKVMVLHE